MPNMSKSKKPDRFARMVGKVQRTDDWGIDCVSSDEVVKLLRAEHRAVFRLVKQQTILAGNVIDRGVLIAALARRMQ
jgi:hypothetical protein